MAVQNRHGEAADRMPVERALEVVLQLREGRVVVTNQSSARLWPRISDDRLDFNYNPSTMGGAIPFALGIALARPDRETVVFSGDGSLLMSLGALVTVADSGATNLTVVLLDNGMYEVTGGQRTPASRPRVDYAQVARGARFPTVGHFTELAAWRDAAIELLAERGPRFIWLEVGPTPAEMLASSSDLPAMASRVQRLKEALEGHSCQ